VDKTPAVVIVIRRFGAVTMTDCNSTVPTPAGKPAKPYPDFPLFPHAAGQWAKKVRGRLHYFGVWADPDAALAKYLEQKDALHAGRKPRPDAGAATVKDVANDFLNAKRALVDAGELSPRTWADYKQVCDLVVAHLGKSRPAEDAGPDDFAALRNKVAKDTSTNPVSQETRKLLKALCLNGRKGLGFYPLRHVFRTVADEAKDQPAVDFLMGHEVSHVTSVYRETISDERLKAVTDHVHAWLFPPAAADPLGH
jgi:hypothetical protein